MCRRKHELVRCKHNYIGTSVVLTSWARLFCAKWYSSAIAMSQRIINRSRRVNQEEGHTSSRTNNKSITILNGHTRTLRRCKWTSVCARVWRGFFNVKRRTNFTRRNTYSLNTQDLMFKCQNPIWNSIVKISNGFHSNPQLNTIQVVESRFGANWASMTAGGCAK